MKSLLRSNLANIELCRLHYNLANPHLSNFSTEYMKLYAHRLFKYYNISISLYLIFGTHPIKVPEE